MKQVLTGSTEEQRRAKVERLRAEGVDPYPHSFEGRVHVEEILAAHDPAELGEGSTSSSPTG